MAFWGRAKGSFYPRWLKRQCARALIVLQLLNLAGCVPEQTKALADCQKEADRFFMGYRNDDAENPRSRFIIECMGSKGYDFTVESKDCDNRYPLTTQTACYSPHDWVDRIELELNRKLQFKTFPNVSSSKTAKHY